MPRSAPLALALLVVCLVAPATVAPAADPAPAGQTFAVHFTLAPRWLDRSESEGSITPFRAVYAVHGAVLKPMPSGSTASIAC